MDEGMWFYFEEYFLMKTEIKKIKEVCALDIDWSNIPYVIAELEKYRELDGASLQIEVNESYGSRYIEVNVAWYRDETPEEKTKRERIEATQSAVNSVREKNQLKELLKKYPEIAKEAV